MLNDFLSLFDVLKKDINKTKRRPLIHLNTVKESYQRYKINNFEYIRFKYILHDALTKDTRQSILEEVLKTQKLKILQSNV